MALNPAVPFYSEGKEFTCHAQAAVVGKRFVRVSGPAVAERPQVSNPAVAGQAGVIGVAGFSAAVGEGVTVYRSPNVMPVEAGAALAAGGPVMSDAVGRAIPHAGAASGAAGTATILEPRILGYALADAANGADAKIALL